ncbi:hypothetical protein KV205_23820 [Streptomyces sp. SKN60]|uniref:hypothetical protein n=1 Tax=Streptomyces sp. SKN60 TaxID=2855506 RepID=UPI0022458550|nr:hypothetical protein [Streptomyces sp. SKN60]MCX2183531.1 hypothetical protein [Streptomyces sp. SKN60]
MASHTTTLRATGIVAAALLVGAAPVALAPAAHAAPPPVSVRAPSPTPAPDPFKGLTADQIGDKAVAATQSATSLRMTGRVSSGGQPLDVDFSVSDKSECTGAIKLRGGTAELRRAGGVTYMKGDEAFWRASMTSQGMPPAQIDATIELLKGRWLKIPQGQPGTEDLGSVCDLKSLLADLGRNKEERTGLVRGPDGEVKGTPVATLVKRKTEGGTTTTTTVSVSERGKPYILKTVKTGGTDPGSVVLSDYDKPVKVVTPPADQTVDLTKLDQGTPA